MADPNTLPPLVETFPEDRFPLREIGAGFTAQSVCGPEAQSCAAIAIEMMLESRQASFSGSSEGGQGGGASWPFEGTHFPVPDLPLPDDAAKVCTV